MIKVYKNFLTEGECSEIKTFVYDNKHQWIDYPDYSVGASSSIKVLGNSFFRHLLKTNFDIDKANSLYDNGKSIEYPWMYNLLLERFSNIFECSYMQTLAKPAFQIVTQETPRVWHYDDEKTKYKFDQEFPDYTGFNYFDSAYTLTIMISSGSFSYNYYPETLSKYSDTPTYYCRKHHGLNGDLCDCDLKEYKVINYGVGDLVLTKDRYLHRVGISNYSSDSERITIQGHIVSKNTVHYLYW